MFKIKVEKSSKIVYILPKQCRLQIPLQFNAIFSCVLEIFTKKIFLYFGVKIQTNFVYFSESLIVMVMATSAKMNSNIA